MLDRIADGRTDLVFDYLAEGHSATSTDRNGVALIKWCAYFGDVSAIRFLVANGESLESLGENLDLNGAAFQSLGGRAIDPGKAVERRQRRL